MYFNILAIGDESILNVYERQQKFVGVLSFKTYNGVKYYSAWFGYKSVKTK